MSKILAYYIPVGVLDPKEAQKHVEQMKKELAVPDDVCKEQGIVHQIFFPVGGDQGRIETIPLND